MPRMISAKQADDALAALALMEAHEAGNLAGLHAITASTDLGDLVRGLILLVGAARSGHAAAAGVDVAEVDEMLRAMYLAVTG